MPGSSRLNPRHNAHAPSVASATEGASSLVRGDGDLSVPGEHCTRNSYCRHRGLPRVGQGSTRIGDRSQIRLEGRHDLELAPEPMQQRVPAQEAPLDTDWMGQGRCKDMHPGAFFPSDWIGVQSAQQICLECTVSEQCLRYALANRITDGVWGGTSERQRSRLLRGRGPRMTIPDRVSADPIGGH